MHLKINAIPGTTITHYRYGIGVVKDIREKGIIADFPECRNCTLAIYPHKDIKAGDIQLVEQVFDGPVGDYEIEYATESDVRKITVFNKTEQQAVDEARQSAIGYLFFVNEVRKI